MAESRGCRTVFCLGGGRRAAGIDLAPVPRDAARHAARNPRADRSSVVVDGVLSVGAFAGMTVEQFATKQRRAAWRRRNPARWQKRGGGVVPFWAKHDAVPVKTTDAADQLRTVMGADFKRQMLLNRPE